jgi:hypothetical protein
MRVIGYLPVFDTAEQACLRGNHGAKVDRPIAHVGSYIVEPASRQASLRLVKVAVLLRNVEVSPCYVFPWTF